MMTVKFRKDLLTSRVDHRCLWTQKIMTELKIFPMLKCCLNHENKKKILQMNAGELFTRKLKKKTNFVNFVSICRA